MLKNLEKKSLHSQVVIAVSVAESDDLFGAVAEVIAEREIIAPAVQILSSLQSYKH